MLKVVIQILLITFILILCYDTFDICLNQINSKKESELLIVKHEIEETEQQFDYTTHYETNDFPIWPVALGFSCAFCSVVCHFILPLKSSSAERSKSLSNLPRNGRNYKKENDKLSCFEAINQKDGSEHCFDVRINDEVIYCKDFGLINRPDSSHENDSKTNLSAQWNKGELEKSFMNVCTTNLFRDERIPVKSVNAMNNLSFSTSVTSLEHLDCSNSKNLYNMLLENKTISKMGLPTSPINFYGEDNNRKNQLSKTMYEENYEILAVNNALFEENVSQKNEDSNDSVSIKQGHIMGLFSMLNNDLAKSSLKTTSDKSINVQLLTYSNTDIKNIEKRLENIECGLKKSEEKTKDWGKRINAAETELVDLHEQMYTIFSKFEEEKKTNYIIVSKISKDKIFPNEKEILHTLAEESDEFEQVDDKEDDASRNKTASAPDPESDIAVKESSEESLKYCLLITEGMESPHSCRKRKKSKIFSGISSFKHQGVLLSQL
ncbi:uncharacterized protein [Halyomorpha halys]|uniref:uncharacterized protein isoform X2 n=1 Tax=Halyomorpha halys TaxID=286706 RepID=UPI0006D50081|nr:uncharacterized protein LOC106690022 isoform X2 [Halyomorpha halys]